MPIFDARFDARLDTKLDARNYVMVPMLDTRMFQLKLDMSEMEKRLLTRMMGFGLTTTGLIITAVFSMRLNLKR